MSHPVHMFAGDKRWFSPLVGILPGRKSFFLFVSKDISEYEEGGWMGRKKGWKFSLVRGFSHTCIHTHIYNISVNSIHSLLCGARRWRPKCTTVSRSIDPSIYIDQLMGVTPSLSLQSCKLFSHGRWLLHEVHFGHQEEEDPSYLFSFPACLSFSLQWMEGMY